jgi:hypothetical protein
LAFDHDGILEDYFRTKGSRPDRLRFI